MDNKSSNLVVQLRAWLASDKARKYACARHDRNDFDPVCEGCLIRAAVNALENSPVETSAINSPLAQAVLDQVVGTNLGMRALLVSYLSRPRVPTLAGTIQLYLTQAEINVVISRLQPIDRSPLCPGELAQLRRIDRTARALAESVGEWDSYPPFVALQEYVPLLNGTAFMGMARVGSRGIFDASNGPYVRAADYEAALKAAADENIRLQRALNDERAAHRGTVALLRSAHETSEVNRLRAGLQRIGELSLSYKPIVDRLLAGESIEQIAQQHDSADTGTRRLHQCWCGQYHTEHLPEEPSGNNGSTT